MASTTVRGTIFAEPISVPTIVEAINNDLTGQGFTVDSFGIGDTDSVIPATVEAHWVIENTDGRDVAAAVRATAARHSALFGAWKDFSVDFGTDVIAPTLAEAGTDLKGLGLGLGLGVVALIVGAGVVLVLMARAGAFQSIKLGAV